MPFKPLPVRPYDAAEHARLDKTIRRALGAVGRTERWLQQRVGVKFETSSHWRDLTATYKLKILAGVETWAAEEGT